MGKGEKMRLIDADNLKIPSDAPYKASVKRVVAQQPTVEAVPVVHGEWILEEKAGVDYWCCSHCHKIRSEYYAKPKDNFCPECGADMRKKVGYVRKRVKRRIF